jgi:prolyl oligopeptidase
MTTKSAVCRRSKIFARNLIYLSALTAAALLAPFAGQLTTRAAAQNGTIPDAMHVPPPPVTRTDNIVDDYFGTNVTDPYRWLEDQNSPETRAWIEAQNTYTDSIVKKLPGRGAISGRVSQLLKVDQVGLPMERNGRYFFSKRAAAEDQSKLYFRQGPTGKDELLVDPLPMSADHSTTVNFGEVSRDGSLMIYMLRQGGADEEVPHLFNVDQRREITEEFPKARYFSTDFSGDKSGVYYSRQTEKGPRVFWHKLGTPSSEDKIIFGEGYGPEKIISSSVSEDGQNLLIHVLYGASGDKVEVYVKNLAKDGPIVTVVNGVDARFQASFGGQKIYIQTNWDAPLEKIMATDIATPGRDHWKTVVPESKAHIEGLSLVGGKLSVLYSRNASSELQVFDATGKPVREVAMPAIGTALGLFGQWASSETFYYFASYFVPGTVYRYDLNTGAQSVWYKPDVPVKSDEFEVRQVWFNSKDGTRVPMFVAHKKGLKLDGSAPALLTGYGGFNVSETPFFSSSAVVWMEQGGIFADANMRGGGEFGEKWHQAGMHEKKQNVFDDFIAAAEWLIASHYTSPAKLAIRGGSNGGLLMGAMITQRPDLFAAVLCQFPLLDMLRYQNFLVARYWIPEYGSSENADEFKYIYAYSPYQHVKAGTKYPAVMFVTGDSDTRVAPLHARKMAALMQASAAPGRPILLKYDTKSGHSGGDPVTKTVEDVTDELSFLLWQVGATPK